MLRFGIPIGVMLEMQTVHLRLPEKLLGALDVAGYVLKYLTNMGVAEMALVQMGRIYQDFAMLDKDEEVFEVDIRLVLGVWCGFFDYSLQGVDQGRTALGFFRVVFACEGVNNRPVNFFNQIAQVMFICHRNSPPKEVFSPDRRRTSILSYL